MKYKEFSSWCNQRAADGCWGLTTAMCCIEILGEIEKQPFWKREKFWKEKYMKDVLNGIVNPIEKKISEMRESGGENNAVGGKQFEPWRAD